jgi:hypothetical protein
VRKSNSDAQAPVAQQSPAPTVPLSIAATEVVLPQSVATPDEVQAFWQLLTSMNWQSIERDRPITQFSFESSAAASYNDTLNQTQYQIESASIITQSFAYSALLNTDQGLLLVALTQSSSDYLIWISSATSTFSGVGR